MSKIDSYEQRFHQIVNNILDIIVEIDLEGNFTYVSPQVYDILGYNPDEVTGISGSKLIHPEDLPKFMDKMKDLLNPKNTSSAKIFSIEYRIIHKKGHYIFLSARGSLVEIEGDVKVIAVLRDVSEQSKYKQRLEESEENFRNIAENSLSGIFIVQDDVIKYANRRMSELNGYSLEEIMSWQPKEHLKTLSQESLDFILEQRRNQYLGVSEVKSQFPLQIVKKTGEKIWVENFSTSINYEGKPANYVTFFDYTDKVETEQKLKESERKYREILENMMEGYFESDLKGNFTFVNDSYCKLLGYSKEEIIGTNFRNFLDEKRSKDMIKMYNQLYNNEISPPLVYELKITPSGETIYIEALTDLKYDSEGNKVGFFGLFREVTERKKAEQKLKESEEKYRQLIEDSFVGVWVIDENEYTTLVNPSMSKILGHSAEEMIGTNLFEYVPKKDIKLTKKFLEKRRSGIKEEFEKEFIRKDGKMVYTRLIASPNFDKSGNYIGAIAFVSNITKKKEAEQKLKESEEKFRTIAEQSFVGFVIIQDKRIIYQNNTVSKIFGYMFEDLKDMSIIDIFKFIHPEDRSVAVNRFKKRVEGVIGEMSSKSFRIITKSGEIKWIYVYPKMFQFQEKNTMFATIVDVTKERMAEIELKELNELKSEFLRRASHELKTPLISIKGFTSLVLDKYGGTLDNEIVSMLEEVGRGCYRLEDIIKNLIETTKIESSKLKLETTAEDLSFLIRFCINEIQGLVKSRNQVINVNIDEIIITKFNKEQMYEVITNLLSNAVKYTPPNGEITVKSEIKNKNVIVSIQDNGIGFTDKEKEKVFQQFGKIERYGQGLDIGIDGSGLGLYISKKIVELHSGKIWMESEGKNKGSIFYVLLPLIKN